ncbi:autotransporter domain-containing protein [Allosphingosinicella sp.]|jgi:outer membrane autotransporter protein|uniref:autotransporter domain-containing protein n=1 Tax=Allosphingosinicella sp. TaxID=2823234 RepID=UPI003D7324DB
MCAAAFAALLAPAAAEAQRVNRIIALGDSYIDDGNVFELTGTPRPAIYPNGRFSNGTNLVDTMARELNVPVLNFGIGGAVARAQNTTLPQVQAFDLQVQSFLAGGGPAAFPRSDRTFAPDDLLVLNIGANDARAYERNLGLNPTAAQITTLQAGVPGQAQLAAGDAIRNLNLLVGAGVQNMTVLGGDVGRLPEVRGLPVAAVGSAYSNAYNGLIQQAVAGYAAQGVTVNYLDINRIGDVVEANLAAFGLQSAGACPTACVTTNPELLDRFLFYVDQVHLTSRGFEIVGLYAVSQLEAPLSFEAQSDVGLSNASAFGQLMSGRLDLAESGAENPLSVYLVALTSSHDVAGGQSSFAYDYDSFGAAAGAEYAFGPGVLGAVIAYSRPEADFIRGGRVRADAWQLGAYGKFDAGGASAEVYVGYGWLDYDIRRPAVIDEISAQTDGKSFVAGGEAGYLFDLAGAKAGPVIGVQYARATLDGFTESGDPVLTLDVGRQRVSELIGFAGIEAEAETELGGLSITPHAKLLAEKELDSSGRPILYSNTASPLIVNSFEPEHAQDDVYGRIEGGVSFELGQAVALQIQASATFEHPEHDEVSGFVGFKIGF